MVNLRYLFCRLREDSSRIVANAVVVGVGFNWCAYHFGGEQELVSMIETLISNNAFYMCSILTVFAIIFIIKIFFASSRVNISSWFERFFRELESVLISFSLIIVGTCFYTSTLFYSESQYGRAVSTAVYSVLFLIAYAGFAFFPVYACREVSKPKGEDSNGDI